MGSGGSKKHESFAVAPATAVSSYQSPKAFEAALTARLKKVATQRGLSVTDLRRQFGYDRLLHRIFTVPDGTQWVLKGGGAMLARDRTARHTMDLDMLNSSHDLDAAVLALRAAARTQSPSDHLRYQVVKDVPIAAGDQVPVNGRRVFLEVTCGQRQFTGFHLDVIVEDLITGTVEERISEPLVAMPGIEPPPVRLYPVVDHIADKLAASVSLYGGQPSSRVKDLVDLAVFAGTAAIPADELSYAIEQKRLLRKLDPITSVTTPPAWSATYAKARANAPAPATYEQALADARAFLDPILTGTATGSWHPDTRTWS